MVSVGFLVTVLGIHKRRNRFSYLLRSKMTGSPHGQKQPEFHVSELVFSLQTKFDLYLLVKGI